MCALSGALIGAAGTSGGAPAAATTGAPVITVAPVNLTASPGQPAAFYAGATGQPAPTVQWQVEVPGGTAFVNIPNATGPSFHFAALASFSGAQYRALFTNSAGVAYTRTALLTVRPGPPGPFAEVIFSRTEITGADNCVIDDTDIARLDTVVAPYLAGLGLTATGSVETGPTQQSSDWCTHLGSTIVPSWDQLSALAAEGWTFVDHSATYPGSSQVWSQMTPLQMWQETCGSAQQIDAHGLKGASDMYLWPNSTGQNSSINKYALDTFVAPCFGTNRIYTGPPTYGISDIASLTTSPFRQQMRAANGGSCNVSGLPCSNLTNGFVYRTPAQIIAGLKSLMPGQVFALQAYVLVTGTNPAYTSSPERWDCTSPNPNLHWTNDSERYCWSDFQQVLNYLVRSGIGITQPGVVDSAIGRTGYSDQRVTQPTATP